MCVCAVLFCILRLSPNFFVLIRDQNRCRGMWVPSSTSASMVIQSEDEDIEERNVGAGGVVSRRRRNGIVRPRLYLTSWWAPPQTKTPPLRPVQSRTTVPFRVEGNDAQSATSAKKKTNPTRPMCCVVCGVFAFFDEPRDRVVLRSMIIQHDCLVAHPY